MYFPIGPVAPEISAFKETNVQTLQLYNIYIDLNMKNIIPTYKCSKTLQPHQRQRDKWR